MMNEVRESFPVSSWFVLLTLGASAVAESIVPYASELIRRQVH